MANSNQPEAKTARYSCTNTHYTASNRAKMRKYALENGNLRAMHFSAKFPELKENTVRNFKKS